MNIQSTTGGTSAFNGQITDSGTGILLNSNTGATINFTGGLSLSTGANAAFTATGGGTINATQNNSTIVNTISTTTGTALNVANTTIGANGLTFHSISAGTGASGPTNGIVLNNTGSSDGLHVTGNNTTARDGSGGTIQNTTGDGISLTSTQGVQLAHMNINSTGNNGVFGSAVNGFVSDWNSFSSNGNATKEGAIRFGFETDPNATGLTGGTIGSATETRIDNTLISGSFERGVSIFNNSGMLTRLNVHGTTIQNSTNGSGMLLELRGTAVATADLHNSTFTGNKAAGFQGTGTDNSNLTVNAIGAGGHTNTFSNNNDGVLIGSAGNADVTTEISNNTFSGNHPGVAITVSTFLSSINSGSLSAKILNNNVSVPATGLNDGIQALMSGVGTVQHIKIDGNTITDSGTGNGIFVGTPDNGSSPNFTAIITNNSVTMNDHVNSGNGISAQVTRGTAVSKIEQNTVSGAGIDGIFLFRSNNGTTTSGNGSLERGVDPLGTAASTALHDNNPGAVAGPAAGTLATEVAGTFTVVNNGTITLPLLAALGGVETSAPSDSAPPANNIPPQDNAGSLPADITLPVESRPPSSGESPVPPTGQANGPTTLIIDDGILSQAELDSLVAAAIARWEATGLSAEQITLLHSATCSVSATLPTGYLGAESPGHVDISANGGGYGWFVDSTPNDDSEFPNAVAPTRLYTTPDQAPAGQFDLLTAVEHEMGHLLGLGDHYDAASRNDPMFGYLTFGERRLPIFGEASGAVPGSETGVDFLGLPTTIGTISAGTTIHLQFQVTIKNPVTGNPTQIQNTGQVSGSNFSTVSTTTATTTLPVPTVTLNTANLAATATQIIIAGTNFSTTPANNIVTFNLGATGTVTAATATQLTVQFVSPPTAGNLTAIVSLTNGLSSGAAVQVASVTPVVTLNTANLAANATTVIINGFGFDATPGNNTVAFNNGATGTVTGATYNQLTVTSVSGLVAGSLTANVTTNGKSSGAVQVATVTPVVTSSTAHLAATANTVTIAGFGFSTTAVNNTVVFNDGAIGSVTTASLTSLTVTFSTKPTSAGSLTAIVTSNSQSSGSATQVATVTPVITASSASLAANATTITITGFGFDATAGNNTVAFNDGAVGTVTTASPTSLLVTFSTKPTSAGSLTAIVTSNSVQSEVGGVVTAVQVATVTPVVTLSTTQIQTTDNTVTINGFGFASSNANNTVVFNLGATGTVTTSSPTQLIVTFGTHPTTGNLTAVVTSNTVSSGAAVQVATVVALSITPSNADLAINAPQIIIHGNGFSTTLANDSVVFDNGAIGNVTAATPTQLTVTFTTQPTALVALNATVTVTGVGTSGPTQVANIVAAPTVTTNTADLPINAATITIAGTGFSTTPANNTVAFNDGAAGNVTASTATSLTVTFTTPPSAVGTLTAIVTSNGGSSGAAVQVARVIPVVTMSTANLAANATSIIIAGFGFDPIAGNNTVTFNDGAVGSVTTATANSLTVTFSTKPTSAGILTASVTTDTIPSGAAVQVATVTPVVTMNTTNLAANATSIVINGFGFDSTAGNNTVVFNDGAVGSVTTASPTSLTVTFSTKPSSAGSLTAIVTSNSVGSGAPVQVATVTPVVTVNTANLPANATSIVINGFGFDPTAGNNTVVFNDGAVGSVTTASLTSLTVTFSTKPTTAGSLTAIVTTNTISSGSAVQVATVTPVVTLNTASLAANAASIVINGFGFDPTAGNNTVVFNDGAVGSVTTASPTSLTVTFSTKPTSAGSLTAVVTTNTISSGAAVQVATVTPVITMNTANLAANATSIVINGFGFDSTAGNNTVVFNDGAVGSVTTASPTSLTVTFSTKPTSAGSLTAIVISNSVGSGAAVQVATVTPVVTLNTANLAADATTITIAGFGFDPTAGNNTVVFNDGAVGSVTTASPTSLTVTFSTKPTSAGSLTAIVTSNSVGSGAAVQVATVTPVVTLNTANLAANTTSVVINGFGFDSTAGNNAVVFNDGAVGSVTTATSTSLIVTFSTKPTSAGSLTAIVTTNSVGSGAAVQVATVTPVVTLNTANLAANATTITINGFGFDPTAGNNTVVFNDGAVGSVTTASPTSLIVTFSTKPTSARQPPAVVTSNTVGSGAAVQVATVTPIVTMNTAQIANTATLVINGFCFVSTPANNTVAFNLGAAGTVTAASPTQLTVSFATQPTSTGSLTAVVTTNGVSSGAAIQVATVVSITLSALPDWTINRPYTPVVTATGGSGPYTFSLVSGTLPTGLTLNANGTFTGSPTATGPFTFSIKATQSATASGTRSYTVTINAAPTISNLTVTAWTKGKSGFTGTMTISNGTPPHSITAQSNLPPGLTAVVTGNTISFTGTPTMAGIFSNCSITVTDSAGAQVTKVFTITINAAQTFTPATLPAYTVGTAYSRTITTAGGTGARVVTYTLSGPLPTGMTMTPSGTSNSITISGTPKTAGNITITMTVTDSVGATTVITYRLVGNLSPTRRGL